MVRLPEATMPVNTKHSKPPRARVRPDVQKQDAPKVAAKGPAVALAPPQSSQPRAKVYATLCLLLAAVTFIVYSRALTNPFVNYDDQGYVVENSRVQQGLTLATLRWALTSTDATNWHPLTWLSHAADCQLFGLNPKGHHLTSVLLHVCNVVLLFLLLARVTGSIFKRLLVAALFALHPINVESVAWIAERKTVLCMFFILLTFAAYGWYARRPRLGRYLAVVGLFILALAAKPMAVTLPFALLLLDFWPLGRVSSLQTASEVFPVPRVGFGRLVLEKLPLVLLSAASSAVTLFAQKAAVATNEHVPLFVRLANACYAYSTYIFNAFWPVGLASFYPYEGYRLPVWQFVLCALFLVAVTAWTWGKRARTYLPVGWLWFLGTLVPMIGLVQVGDQAMADRYAYLPLIGIFVMAVWGVADLAEKHRIDVRLLRVGAVVIIVALSLLTWRQIGYWRSSRDLWTHALQVTKDNYMAEDYVGSALLVENYEATGQRHLDEALVHFKNAVRINPNDAISHLNLGADMHEHGQLREAIEQYQTVLSLTQDPHLVAKSFIDLGAAYQQLGDYAASEQYFREAQKMEPDNEVILLDLGKLGMAKRARELSTAAAAHPTPGAYLQLGQLQQAAGMIPEARQSYEAALKLNPKFVEAQKALAGIGQDSH
ncbi:MAG: tetratricopeptide repeat protein [Candidatus Sulfotelmatobacter sp.]